MKTTRLTAAVAGALVGAALLAAFSPAAVRAQTPAPAAPGPAAAPVPPFPSAQWIDIREYTYEQRASFFAGFKGVQAKVDVQIAELSAQRAAMKSDADTRDWDLAMQEMNNSRLALRIAGEDLLQATPQQWNPLKEKVGLAWQRTQDAYAKVNQSTTG